MKIVDAKNKLIVMWPTDQMAMLFWLIKSIDEKINPFNLNEVECTAGKLYNQEMMSTSRWLDFVQT